MKILFLTLAKIDSIETSGIYTDLLRKFRDNGHEVIIVSPNERKYGVSTKYLNLEGISLLNVWTTNIQKTNLIEKGVTTLLIEIYYYFAIKKFVNYKDVDLILYSTPPITFTNIINKIKKRSNAVTYLLLKDIFPQNAVDLKFIKKNSLLHRYFREKEKTLYNISDFIGCMSPENLNYLVKENPELDIKKLEVNPNSIEIKYKKLIRQIDLYDKYKIPKDKVIFIFGGNLGLPQGIEYLKSNIKYCESISEAFFLIIGNGTEYQNIRNWIKNERLSNVLLINELPKYEFDEILKLVHVGLIFLNPLFTIPNFPSRILSYLYNKLPVICATDSNTDIGVIAEKNNFGFNCISSDYHVFFEHVTKLLNEETRGKMGVNAFQFLEKECNVDKSFDLIIEKANFPKVSII
jgi:glycosyltransferase involved in cell wall biosynthesis